jgi:hypothetical protein
MRKLTKDTANHEDAPSQHKHDERRMNLARAPLVVSNGLGDAEEEDHVDGEEGGLAGCASAFGDICCDVRRTAALLGDVPMFCCTFSGDVSSSKAPATYEPPARISDKQSSGSYEPVMMTALARTRIAWMGARGDSLMRWGRKAGRTRKPSMMRRRIWLRSSFLVGSNQDCLSGRLRRCQAIR